MEWHLVLLALVVGYFIGSISMARLIIRFFALGKVFTSTSAHLEGSNLTFDSKLVSATSVTVNFGAKYGFLTMLLDMLKIAVPVLIIKLLFSEHPYFLITATAGMVGHVWPVYYRFQGGRGILAVYGALFVIDWIGVFVTSILGMVFGLSVLRDVLAAYMTGVVFIIPWLWFRTHNIAYVIYAVIVNVILFIAMIPEAKELKRLKKDKKWDDPIAVFQLTGMGRGVIKIAKKMGIIKNQSDKDLHT
jgi:acyl phosphate:glycerol-3-phosphate acyltransferase